ncbi:hypothetical protein ACHAWF_011380 [Thalassiosira exigua]
MSQQSSMATPRPHAESCSFVTSLIVCSILVAERGTVESLPTVDVAKLRFQHCHHRASVDGRLAGDFLCATGEVWRNPSPSRLASPISWSKKCGGSFYSGRHSRPNCLRSRGSSSSAFRLMASKDDQPPGGKSAIVENDLALSSDLTSLDDEEHKNATVAAPELASDEHQKSTTFTQLSAETNNSSKWEANNFESDLQLLKNAIARQSAMSNLQQQHRKYTLDHGFARNRRPLVQDALNTAIKIGGWIAFFMSGQVGDGVGVLGAWRNNQSWRLKLQCLLAHVTLAITTLHHWIVCMALPLVLLTLTKCQKLGPSARPLDEYVDANSQSTFNAPTFFYTSEELSKKRAKAKDTGDFVLCLLENWSSTVIVPLAWGVYSVLATIAKKGLGMGNPSGIGTACTARVYTRLFTRLGAAAALHQYPSLLFELRRHDQPRPLCCLTAHTQKSVEILLRWLPLGVASDVALLLARRKVSGRVPMGTAIASIISILLAVFQLGALVRIVRLSQSSALSLSEATSFPTCSEQMIEGGSDRKVIWRYQLRWRTPQRIIETLRSWRDFFFTGHVPLLLATDYWKKQPIRFDEFSTEGMHSFLFGSEKKSGSEEHKSDADDRTPHADAIAESLSLIFRDRDAALRNATEARLAKHQESFDTKALDDVLGIAVQQSFGIGVSYDFDHFDPPADGEEVSIHQLRARLAKSAVRRKRELDNAMQNELGVLKRLKRNVVTESNRDLAEKEMKSVELDIRERHANDVDRMRNALLTLIPTNAKDVPKGTERYDSPIMVAEYVDLKAPVEKPGELKASMGIAPDPLAAIEDYVRKDFGDEAADAFRLDEIAARRKEKEMLSIFRERYGQLDTEEATLSVPTLDGIGDEHSDESQEDGSKDP